MVTPTDQVLVAQTLAGDERAFAALYDRHASALLVRLRRMLGQSQDAEDVLQMTFYQVHRTLRRYDPQRPFWSWLNGFALRIASRHMRGRRRRWWLLGGADEFLDWVPDEQVESAEQRAQNKQLAQWLHGAVQRLAPKKRIAFTLHAFENLGMTEIGELLGVSPQTVWARVQSARKELQRRLEVSGLELTELGEVGAEREGEVP